MKHLKTCTTLIRRSHNELIRIAEQNPETGPFLPEPPSLGKYQILRRTENETNLQALK